MGIIILPALLICGFTAVASFINVYVKHGQFLGKKSISIALAGLLLFLFEIFFIVSWNINEGKIYAFSICLHALMVTFVQSLLAFALGLVKREWAWKSSYLFAVSALLTLLLAVFDLVVPLAHILGFKRTF